MEAAAAAAGGEARISTGTEKLQREAFGAKSWLGAELGSWRQRSLSGPLIPGGKRAFMASHGTSGPHHPRPRFQGSIPPPTSQTGEKRKTAEGKQEALSPEFWRAASAKKKKSQKGSLVTAKTTAGTVGEFRPGEVFARPVLRGFGVVQLTHLKEQCLGRSWATFSHSGWYGDIQGILCAFALLS